MQPFSLGDSLYLGEEMKFTEEEKEATKLSQESEPQKVLFADGDSRVVFKDDNLTVQPVPFSNDAGAVCYSYMCIPKESPRTYLPKKAKEIPGLVPAQHFKKLIGGESVTLEDGRVVTPEDVCDSPPAMQCFAFIFMPDSSYLSRFIKEFDQSQFNDFSEGKMMSQNKRMTAIYHSVPKEVMLSPEYQQLMASKFGPDVKHILDCPESNIPQLSKSKATFFTDRIKMVCPHMFPTSYG